MTSYFYFRWTDFREDRAVCDADDDQLSDHRLHQVREGWRLGGTASSSAQRSALGVSPIPDDRSAATRLPPQVPHAVHRRTARTQVIAFIIGD